MSTAKSPLYQLESEAKRAARHIFHGWRGLGRKHPEYMKFAMVMSDGMRIISIKWADLESMTVEEIEAIVLEAMQMVPTNDKSN